MSTNGGDGAGEPRVVVLGGGPAGDVAALRAAQLGADSTLIERAELGGTCLNWGCIPTKSLLATADLLRKVRRADEFGLVVPEVSFDFSKMMERKDQIVLRQRQGVEGAAKRKGVKVVRGEGRVDGDAVVVDGERHPFDHLVVCVGTEPSGLPGFDMEHPAILTSNDILVLEKVPESMLVVGGGVVGCEFASLFAPLGTKITVVEILPRLLLGARNTAVAQVGDELRRLHYAAPYGLRFDGRMLDAVYAFQKVHGLPRTGAVDARFWQALANPRHPAQKFARPAAHIEVNKGLQVLYVVRGSKIALIVPISTAGIAGAFTPVGTFAVYRKVGGFDPSPLGTLYDPLYFTGGYAIHGNPSVPPYPASHGCVRVPMWVAPQLYKTIPYGETVYVY